MRGESRPKAASAFPDQEDSSLFHLEPISAQLRRRRAASLRCEPMEDGRRDPLEEPSPRGRTVRIELGRYSAYIWAPHKVIEAALTATGSRSMRALRPRLHAVEIPIDMVDDLIAHIEYAQRRRVEIIEVDR